MIFIGKIYLLYSAFGSGHRKNSEHFWSYKSKRTECTKLSVVMKFQNIIAIRTKDIYKDLKTESENLFAKVFLLSTK